MRGIQSVGRRGDRSPLGRTGWRWLAAALAAALIAAAGAVTGPVPPVAASSTGWTTSGTQILTPAGTPYVVAGLNWYGFETKNAVAHGMWTKDYRYILDQAKALGYNTIRLPFSNSMWRTNPRPGANTISACADCKGKRSRDIMALIVNYAGAIGLHVILDNHRSTAGNSAESNGLWYNTSGKNDFTEQHWIEDWVSVQEWIHGIPQTFGAPDTVTATYLAADGFPTVIGFDLRNEPHTPCTRRGCDYSAGAQWGTGDGISPGVNPNPNPFAPACVATSTCKDWRLAAQRAGTTILGAAAQRGWHYPLIIVEGISQYPAAGGTAPDGPFDYYWWGGVLQGVNGNSTNAGAPVVLNAGGSASGLGPPVYNQLVYSAHDYGPHEYPQPWFNSTTCYASGCGGSSLSDLWFQRWAFINTGDINPVWPGHATYPWANTGHTAYTSTPVLMGEFGTGKHDDDSYSTGAGSQGQWFTAMVNFIQSSYDQTAANYSGIPVQNLHWTYWAINTEDAYGLLGSNYDGLANAAKQYSFLCMIQRPPFALLPGIEPGQCGSTGPLPSAD